ncbi:MAG: acyl-CoA/acyl-ACP dehydrogenase [Dehalococcoidia bacterium]|nr:acyl-CoA/acyl-ACP dehydrogenase [Dehalococcoidia bacterium]MCZ7577454.1 acyl-CoA/acyl-ACP dehydrogenase [Dehalococcoidia bacterium]
MEQWELDLIAKVRDLARGPWTERAARYDREGSFPRENLDELQALKVPQMALAPAIGGLGISPEAQMRVMEEVAYGDGSTAVALNMHVLVASFLESMPPFARRDAVLKDMGQDGALICGPGSVPTGEVDNRKAGFHFTEDGDFVVGSGKAGFASMSEGAKYALMGGQIDRGEGNEPDVVLSIPELSTPGITNLMNWDSMGLRATSSHDIVAENMRLPKSEVLIIPAAMLRMVLQAQANVVNVQTQMRARGALGILAIWLGLGQAAFDFTIDYVKERHGYLAGPTASVGGAQVGYRADQPWAQFGIGNMEHWLETGRIVLYDTIRRLETPFESSQAFTRHLVRTVYHLRRMSEEVSAGAMRVCGAHAYVRNRPLERIYRDMVGGNVMAWKTDELLHSLGLSALGREITFVGPAGT